MAMALQEKPAAPAATATGPLGNRSVSEIIEKARTAPASVWGAVSLCLLTAGLLWGAFFPLNWGPLGWLAPVPLLLLVRVNRPTRWMYPAAYLGGAVFWVAGLQWMRLGDVTMIPAWLALSFYLALYFPLFLGMTRVAVHRLRVPLVVAAPIVWVGLEYLRSHLLSGFGWYLLGHSQHEWTSLVQISDLFGAYGVSGLVMFSAAALATCISESWFTSLRLLPAVSAESSGVCSASRRGQVWGVGLSVLLVAAAVGYGMVRRNQVEFGIGPRVALIQGDFRSDVKHDPNEASQIYMMHFHLTGIAVEHRPDLVVWPETMFPYPLLLADKGLTEKQLQEQHPQVPANLWYDARQNVATVLRDRAEQAGAAMILGVDTRVATAERGAHYNSAVFVQPERGIAGRYDKLHLVPFGEYIPFKDSLPFLTSFTPFGAAFGITPGESVHVFELGDWRLLPLICFEDTVPHLVREMTAAAEAGVEGASSRPVDCLVNLTNDGWFRDSSEPDQHLVTAAFRCIETRTPMVRAVNTGISAMIDGNGVVREPDIFIDYDRGAGRRRGDTEPVRTSLRDPSTGRFHKSFNGALVGNVPLDPRGSLYLLWGDAFAAGCLVLTIALLLLAKFRPTVSVRNV